LDVPQILRHKREFILVKNPMIVKEIVTLLAPALFYLSTKANIQEKNTKNEVTVGMS
jgi:hypothetical protein